MGDGREIVMLRKALRLILALCVLALSSSLGASGPAFPPFGVSAPSEDPPISVTIVGLFPNLLVLVANS
jgi:hypothetical protein